MAAQTPQAGAPQGPNEATADLQHVYATFGAIAAIGFLGAFLYCAATGAAWGAALAAFGGAALVAGAFAFVGGLIGFVFAIPRSRQDQGTVQQVSGDGPRRLSDYAANTNLEQISDWLTKILVGITLVQFGELSTRYRAAADALSPLLGTAASARSATLALMTYFVAWGFYFAYLLTRLWLPKALSRAEREELTQKRAIETLEELRTLEKQVYDRLYEGPPGGFLRAIEAVEKYHSSPGSKRSPWLWMYLASAYGQKHAYDLEHQDAAGAERAKEGARTAVREALAAGPETLPILRQLYRGEDARENDLVTLKGDEVLDPLLG